MPIAWIRKQFQAIAKANADAQARHIANLEALQSCPDIAGKYDLRNKALWGQGRAWVLTFSQDEQHLCYAWRAPIRVFSRGDDAPAVYMREFEPSQIVAVEILKNSVVVTSTRTLGGGIGGALGPMGGAVFGARSHGVSTEEIKSIVLRIVVDDLDCPAIELSLGNDLAIAQLWFDRMRVFQGR